VLEGRSPKGTVEFHELGEYFILMKVSERLIFYIAIDIRR
jgi:hypothetical protein